MWASDSAATFFVSEVLAVPQPVSVRILTSCPIVVFGSIPALLHHFLAKRLPFSIISNRHAEARSWKWAPEWWISCFFLKRTPRISRKSIYRKVSAHCTISAECQACEVQLMLLQFLGFFCRPWQNVRCQTTHQLECTMSNNASTWSVTSTKEKRLEVRWRFPINFYGLWDAVITAFGCNSSGDAFHKFLCSAQHHCLCSRSWHLFWHMFLQKQILKTDHISIYLSIYYVPKGAHARGYALQLKIKHCWKLFLFEMLCTCMNEWIYSTDNFSNQAVVDFKIQSSHKKSAEKWPPKTGIHVPSDFRHFAYKQTASTWRNNHWFELGKHHFIRIIWHQHSR